MEYSLGSEFSDGERFDYFIGFLDGYVLKVIANYRLHS